ncbi:MAG: sulfotransferase [Chloroflexi bacterium]|nr:sulfotransferase [Chloroflexota bacterium]
MPPEGPGYLGVFRDPVNEIAQIYKLRLAHIVPVNQPLLLMSQVQRSGGTLMSQLFDGHPQCLAHPDELNIGRPDKYTYPDLSMTADADQWFEQLFERRVQRLFVTGYLKSPDTASYDKADIFPFVFLSNLQREIFSVTCDTLIRASTQRDVLDAYFTSYFNAWLDYQGLFQAKTYVTAFVPRVSMRADNVDRFFRDYPDGRLVSVIREPKGWYASSHRKGPENYPNPQASLPIWMQSAESMIANKTNYPDKVRLVSFDELLRDTAGVMRRLADWSGLDWHPSLTEPTFQGQPIKANTAFRTTDYGVIDEPRKRGSMLPPEEAEFIDTTAKALYERVLGMCE